MCPELVVAFDLGQRPALVRKIERTTLHPMTLDEPPAPPQAELF
jgi:hypothetical protein